MKSAKCSQKPMAQTVSGSASRKPPRCSSCMKTTSWSWSSVGLITGHLHGHAEVDVIINGLRDAVQDGLPEPRQIRDIGFRPSRLMRVRNRVIDEFEERTILRVEVAEHHV